jgi:hypothetical protein
MTAPNVDRRSGAGLLASVAVGAAPTPADELSTLRKYYPDAHPLGDGNYIYTDPDTKKPTLYKATQGYHPLNWMARNAQEIPALLGGDGGAVGGGVVGAGTGSTLALESYRNLMGHLLGTDNTRTLGQTAGDMATNFAMNAAGEGVGRGVGAAVRAGMPLVGKAVPGVVDAAADLGVDLSGRPAMVTGSKGLMRTFEGVGMIPTATNTLEAGKTRTIDQMLAAQRQILGEVAGPAGQTTADTGKAMERLQAAAKGNIDAFNQNRQTLDTLVDTFGRGTVTVPHNIQNAVTQLRASVADGSPALKASVEDAVKWGQDILDRSRQNALTTGRPGIDFPTMRSERTVLGEGINFNPTTGAKRGSSEQNALTTMYSAARQDLLDSAGNNSPLLRDTLAAHDAFVAGKRGGQANIRPGVGPGEYLTVDELGKFVEKDPAQAFNAVTANSFKSGPNGGDGRELMRVRNSVDIQDWRNFAAHYLERMGQPNPGVAQTAEQVGGAPVFSMSTFATNWNGLSDGAKRALFEGYLPAGQREHINSLAKLANQFKLAGYEANTSGTGNLLTVGKTLAAPLTMAMGGMASGHPGVALLGALSGVGTLAGAPIVLRLMQSPNFVRWLASSAREVAASPNRYTTALSRLGAMQFDSATQNAVNKYIEQARQVMTPAAALAGANP